MHGVAEHNLKKKTLLGIARLSVLNKNVPYKNIEVEISGKKYVKNVPKAKFCSQNIFLLVRKIYKIQPNDLGEKERYTFCLSLVIRIFQPQMGRKIRILQTGPEKHQSVIIIIKRRLSKRATFTGIIDKGLVVRGGIEGVIRTFQHCYTSSFQIGRFSNDCRKTKTKAITPTNHKRSRQHDEPITIGSNYL